MIMKMIYETRRHHNEMPYYPIKVPVFLIFWSLGLLQVFNILRAESLVGVNVINGVEKCLICLMFFSFFSLMREYVFFENLLFDS